MPVVSVGDMAQQFVSMRNSGTIKQELDRLAESLSSGVVTDITRHLGGETAQLSGINYSLSQITSYQQAARETEQTLTGMQLVLSEIDTVRSEMGAQLVLDSFARNGGQIEEASASARGSFETMVNALNTRLADRSLFAGTEVFTTPLADADTMLADLLGAIGGATTLADVTTAIDAWFDDPAGGFATIGYQGDTGPIPRKRVSENKSFAIDARADDPAIRDVLKATAFASLASEVPGLNVNTQIEMLREGGTRMVASGGGLIGVQTRVGFAAAGVDQAATELAAQRTMLEMSRNNLIAADPFETASKLQSVQLQLETHYSVTARMSRLSLLSYL